MQIDETLEVQGLRCPMPLLKAKKALAQLQSGQCLQVIATDPGAVGDFKHYSELSGHRLLDWRQQDACYYFYLEKK